MNKPLVSTDIVIRQDQISTSGCGLCGNAGHPTWQYVSPTPQLEQKGLTSNVLREIIESINQNSLKDFKANYNPNYSYIAILPILGIIIGFIICITGFGNFEGGGSQFIIGMVVFGVSGFLTVCLNPRQIVPCPQ